MSAARINVVAIILKKKNLGTSKIYHIGTHSLISRRPVRGAIYTVDDLRGPTGRFYNKLYIFCTQVPAHTTPGRQIQTFTEPLLFRLLLPY